MKFNCGPSWSVELARLESWHWFFPWIPRRVDENDCRAFEWIERKGKMHADFGDQYWTWEYRVLNSTTEVK